MRANADEYLLLYQGLLPLGAAWPREPGATLTKMLFAQADEATRIHNRAVDLLDEADPRTTAELIGDWERVTGLPDACSAPYVTTLQERRAAVVARLTARGGQSRQFYIDLAASLGYAITITEFRPFRVGRNACGDPLCGEEWSFVWRVNAPETTVRYFRTGSSAAGEPLRTWGNELLECAIARVKPAHTLVQFGYGG